MNLGTRPESAKKLTVVVTGATGDVGRPLLKMLSQHPEVAEIRAISRRVAGEAEGPKIDYRPGDVCDQAAMRPLLDGADALVHLAFSMFGTRAEMVRTNIDGVRSIYEAAKQSGISRLVYTSSVAAYGFARDHELPITERTPIAQSPGDIYSSHKARCEQMLTDLTAESDMALYVLRPCIVAGSGSLGLIRANPHVTFSARLPGSLRRRYLDGRLGPLTMPDTGVRWQLVHADDLARAIVSALTSSAPPGAYNIAGSGDVGQTDVARSLGWTAIKVPRALARGAARAIHLYPWSSSRGRLLANMLARSMTVDCAKANKLLGWRPARDPMATLWEAAEAARAAGIV